jgi:predicted metal-dependent peptidase
VLAGQPDQDSDSLDDEGQLEGNNGREPTDIEEMLRGMHGEMDEHDFEKASEYDIKKLAEKIDGALRQGGILAGILGGDKPRNIDNLLDPKIDWKEVLREFVSSICVGKPRIFLA